MDEALRTELVTMCSDDQAAVGAVYATAERYRQAFESSQADPPETPWPFVLFEWVPADQAPPEVRLALRVVRRNTARLKAVVAEHGWPGRSLVGEDGALAAWLILQHAGSGVRTIGTADNHAFRRSCVPLLERAVRAGDAHPRHLAHIVDGIHAVAGEPPQYAVLSSAYTIVDGEPVFAWDVDIAQIDRRRERIGLPPLSADVRLRTRPGDPGPIGPDRWEPWPTTPRPRLRRSAAILDSYVPKSGAGSPRFAQPGEHIG